MLYLKEGCRPLSAVIFDLGNVLLDYNPRRFAFEMGFDAEVSARVLAVTVQSPLWARLDEGTLTNEELIQTASRTEPGLRKEIRRYMETWREYFHAIPANVDAFYRVKETGAKVYILSNFQSHTYEYVSAHNSFFQDADGRVLSCETQLMKPHAEIYQYLIQKYALDPVFSVFFDDIEANVEGAHREGMLGVVLPPCAPVTDYLIFDERVPAEGNAG